MAAINPSRVVVQGTLRADGTLELDEKPNLPAGRVQVTLAPADQPREDTWTILERIWQERQALGMKSRSREEVDSEIQALRDELDERLDAIDQTREEIRRSKEEPGC